MTCPILEIENLSHSFEQGEGGIFDISFSISGNEFILLAGKNGSGKTTLIRHLNGLLRPDSGQVLFKGCNIQKNLTRTRKKVGMIFQDPDTQIIGDTVFDETAFGLENLGFERPMIREKVSRTLDRLDLSHLKDRNPSTLSGGEKRRLAIAGVLVMEPEVILFDEPFANLDHPSTQALAGLARELNRAGHAIVMATHDVEPVIRDATRILIMENGRVAEDGRPDALVKKLESHGVKEPWSSRPGLDLGGSRP
ncbi:energy-coupling factor ABC transporter ATP-binding protein [Desulfospira joergensenii]|uniref:energy-coupling factor ABC transporter ATP-binding protein n=1 Tax=Desulfospira joergensenii TaxID=53329 RepID=UPI0003B4C964|nr:ABC transporter ATP-binding protein [Desulfospira joergensenii]